MTRIVGVHGIRNYRYFTNNGRSAESASARISADWTSWLAVGSADLRVAYYAHLLHRGIAHAAVDDPGTLTPGAQAILTGWVAQLMDEPALAHGERTAWARQAADWVSRHWGKAARAFMLAFCREADTYLSDPVRRGQVRAALTTTLREHRPEVIIAHSLGSVVAYEALWECPSPAVRLLITVGSPLAMPKAVFDRLVPAPVDGQGGRPPGVACWVNLADVGDIVVIPRGGLGNHFTGIDKNLDVVIGKNAFHSIQAYLACPELRELVT